jgi:parallel beta-helix repeat protein
MFGKTVSAIMLTLLLTSMLTLAFNIQPVKSDYLWTETIYIRADGSIEPLGAPVSTVDYVTYTLTDNIVGAVPGDSSAIVIQRNNTLLDGAGYIVQGTVASSSRGIYLNGGSNVTIKNTAIEAFDCGIFLSSSSNNIIGNNITANNYCGIWLYSPSSGNSISGNNITNNEQVGIVFASSSNNIVSGNNIANNHHGIFLSRSSNNCIAQNNLTANDWFGMRLDFSSNNNITENMITDGSIGDARAAISLLSSSYCNVARNSLERNSKGLYFTYADDTTVVENEIVGNLEGFSIASCSNTFIIHNSFIDNTKYVILNSTNLWNASYPSGGNYWSDYNGTDLYHGPYQNETGSDGMGDTPYVIDEDNQDNYPLMSPWPSGWKLDFSGPTSHPLVDFAVYNESLYAAADDKLYVKEGSTWTVVPKVF